MDNFILALSVDRQKINTTNSIDTKSSMWAIHSVDSILGLWDFFTWLMKTGLEYKWIFSLISWGAHVSMNALYSELHWSKSLKVSMHFLFSSVCSFSLLQLLQWRFSCAPVCASIWSTPITTWVLYFMLLSCYWSMHTQSYPWQFQDFQFSTNREIFISIQLGHTLL